MHEWNSWYFFFLFLGTFIISNIILLVRNFLQKHRIGIKTKQLQDQNNNNISPIPITLLTGFLGSGKTTLLNAILSAEKKLKVMVLINEMGSISIDHQLIRTKLQNGIQVFKNGCMCCQVSTSGQNDLERILDTLLDISKTKGFDYIIVETSGFADPGPIVQAFLQLKRSCFCTLDSVVCLVDASTFIRQKKADIIEMKKQLLYSDRIVINKTDRVLPSHVETITKLLSSEYEATLLYSNMNDFVPVSELLSIGGFDISHFLTKVIQLQKNIHQHTPNINTLHLHDVRSVSSMSKFAQWLKSIVTTQKQESIFRLKGFIYVKDITTPYIIHCVLDTYTIAPVQVTSTELLEEKGCNLVLIGHALEYDVLNASFQECFIE